MALVPYTITVIERDTADAAASGKQVVVGAVCSMFLQPTDTTALLYDDAEGNGGSTAKTTNANGQVTVYVDAGDYRVSANGNSSFISLLAGGTGVVETVTETQTLAAAQTVVTLVDVTTTSTAFYINGPSVDNGRLVLGVDYTVDTTAQITLATSYADGTLITAVQNDTTEGIKPDIQVFDSVFDMQQSTIEVGKIAKTKGYYTPNDGGGAEYLIVASGTGTDDGGSYIDLALNQAELVNDGVVNIRQFGAKGDGVTDDTLAIQSSISSNLKNVFIPQGDFLIGAGGLNWVAGVSIFGVGSFVRNTAPTSGCLTASGAGTYRIEGVSFNDGGHSSQAGMIESTHQSAKLYIKSVFATNGYAGVWAKKADIVDIDGGEYWDASHNIYLGDNNSLNLPAFVNNVTLRGVISRNARTGGDGLKTVSGVKKLIVLGGRYYANAQDGIDLFAGCDEAMLVGVDCSGNTVNGVDIKVGIEADLPVALWGQRRRIAIIGGYYNNNTEVGVKVFGDAAEGYFQDVLIQGVNIIGNQTYGIQCRGIAPRILNNLLIGNAVSTVTSYSIIYMQGDALVKPRGGIIAHNTVGNNGVTGKTNVAINVLGWDGLLIESNIIGNDPSRTEPQELDWGIATNSDCENIRIVDNQFGLLNTFKINIAANSCVLGINAGLNLKTSGLLTISSGTTSAVTNHNADGRPDAFTQVRWYPRGTQAGSGFPYSGAASTTQITVNVSTAPSSDISVGWAVDLTDQVNVFAIAV